MSPHDDIKELIKLYERKTSDGRTFVLVESLTEVLKAKYNNVYQTLYDVMCEAHERFSYEPPDILFDKLPSMCRILYALLELGHAELLPLFRQLRDDDLPICEEDLLEILARLDEQELGNRFGDRYRDFPNRWLEAQTAWCPFVFELGPQLDVKVHPHRIIPFYDKIPIQPYGDGQEPPPNRARLYQVHIPKELVKASGLDPSQLLRYEDPPGSPDRTYWRFALKEFPESLKQSFEKEVKTFRALGAQSGMIRYYGCYESTADSGRPTYGILLEYADFDLNGAVNKEEPPVSPDEIYSFYESMHEVAATLTNIHHLDINGRKYDFWHGDIKPENILRVGDHFKLSDPGDSWIQLAPEGGNFLSKAEVYGGTRTYAAPEKARWLEGDTATVPDKIFQNSDVWSLGCVFSIAATYVVLGEQGVKLYDSIRRHAHAKLNAELIQDIFHANGEVLDVVNGWHKYLRVSARRGDAFTARILDMVDDYMLVMPPEKRWEAKQVSEHFDTLIKDFEADSHEVPEVIEKILRELDLRAEIDQESEGGINRLDSDMAKKQFRQEEETEARTITRSRFKSEARLLSTRIKPTAQRSVHRGDLLKRYNQSSEPLPTIRSLPMSSHASHTTGTGSAATVPDLAAHSPIPEMFTVFQIKDQLEAVKRDRNLGPLKTFRDLRPRARRKSVKGEIDDDWLLPHYKDRDLVFLVDNGSTMEGHWYEATFLLEVLIWRVLGYDSDGIELFFTNPDTRTSVGPDKKQTVQTFVEAMRAARPGSTYYAKTRLRPRLSKIMSDYHEAGGKPRTVFILTDGLWEDMPYEEDIDEWIKQNLCELAGQDPKTLQSPSRVPTGVDDWKATFEKSRPITFQFIAFGHSELGKKRMERLDNLLSDQGLPDLIDMEPSTGDAYKMLLGSLVPWWDKKENPVNRLRDLSPAQSTYTSPSSSVAQGLDLGQRTPRSTTISSQYSEDYWTNRASRTSLTQSPPYLVTSQTGESSQGSLAPRSHGRPVSVSRSPSRQSKDTTTLQRLSGMLGRSK